MIITAFKRLTAGRLYLLLAIVPVVTHLPDAKAQSSLDSLQRFFDSVSAYTAMFEQVLLDDQRQVLETSSGQMWIARPGRFRWNYAPPVGQQIISDGERVWIYDADLEQVTVRLIDDALGRTPAILLAGKTHLDDRFDVKSLGQQGAIEWLELTPKDADSQFESVKIGFEAGVLQSMEFLDSLGQVTQIRLSEVVENPTLASDLFSFTPPAGVDVVDESSQ